MAQALSDTDWQLQARARLQRSAGRLRGVLQAAGLTLAGGSALFLTVRTDYPRLLADQLAEQGVLVRVFEQPGMSRFGLAADESQWRKLEMALTGKTCD